jgi:hypothetical protein
MKKYELSDRKLKIGVLLAVALIGWLCFKGASAARSQTTPANLSPDLQEVVKLSATHMSDDVILSYIRNSGVPYNLSADDILYLHSQEISPTVMNALLKAKPDQTSPPKSDDDPPPPPVTQSSAPAPVAPGTPTTPLPTPAATLSDFKSQLAPFGEWVDVPGYGQCWRPSVQDQELGWRPYFNAGHWEYTRAGWFWKSDYSWGQYAFHYGRWMQDARYRWVWRPGYLANRYRLVAGHFVVEGPGRERFGLLPYHDVVPGRVEFRDGHISHVNASQRGY